MEEDEEEVVDCDAPASIVVNGAAVKVVRHLAQTGAQSGGGSETDFKHVAHSQPQSVRLESSGFVKWSLEDGPRFRPSGPVCLCDREPALEEHSVL